MRLLGVDEVLQSLWGVAQGRGLVKNKTTAETSAIGPKPGRICMCVPSRSEHESPKPDSSWASTWRLMGLSNYVQLSQFITPLVVPPAGLG